MKFMSLSHAARASAVAVVCSSLATASAEAPPSSTKTAQISAVYQISLNGFDVGNFRYTSELNGKSYKLNSDVQLSLLLGAFQWKGLSRTTGTTSDNGPKPNDFAFDYSSTLKNGSIAMGFAKGRVETVAIEPPAPTAADTVPVKPEHLTNVLDPLTAILSLTQDTGVKPCERKIAIFDGKQRFDLQMMFRRMEPIPGSTDQVSVCRVKYIPIAGYRATEETANLARTTGIEISFRQVPGARLYVPQKVVLPTLAGTAEITVQQVDIKRAGSGVVALIND